MLEIQYMSVLPQDLVILSVELALMSGLIVNSIRLKKKNKKLKETVSLQVDRIREENLDAMLQNQMYMDKKESNPISNNPYHVQYHEEHAEIYKDAGEHISLQVEEAGILSSKRYVVHVYDHIEIGKDDENKIILNDVAVAGQQIRMMRVKDTLFAYSLDESVPVRLIRHKKEFPLTATEVALKSGDLLKLGNTRLKITML